MWAFLQKSKKVKMSFYTVYKKYMSVVCVNVKAGILSNWYSSFFG